MPNSASLSTSAPASSSAIVEQVASQVAEAREASRSLRPELTVRHSEFGTVAMRIEPGVTSTAPSSATSLANSAATAPAAMPAAMPTALSDWRATLSARDPGFVPAVQAALADRGVQAASESGLLQNGLTQHGQSQQGQSQNGASPRSQDFGSGTATNAFNAQTNAGFGSASGGGSEPRYGSSPGGAQGPAQPYSSEEGDGGSRRTAANSGDADSGGAGDGRGGALFA
ncbi:MAG: hypothetical protein AAFQ13_12010 [Pseudomonadota bacterium]